MSRSKKPLVIEGVSPELLAFLAERVPEVDMRVEENQATLQNWLTRVDEEHIRERFELIAYPYPVGGTIWQHQAGRKPPVRKRSQLLHNWSWEILEPKEIVFAFAL